MRYHYERPSIYLSMYGVTYNCDHPVYSKCTLYQIGKRGLAVIQQRYNKNTKQTWWGEIDTRYFLFASRDKNTLLYERR